MRQAAVMFRHALPDWHGRVDQFVAEGDIVVERFTASGTHRGELMGVAPTGKTIVLPGINVFRIVGDKIVERWGQLDYVGLLRQLGLFTGWARGAAVGGSRQLGQVGGHGALGRRSRFVRRRARGGVCSPHAVPLRVMKWYSWSRSPSTTTALSVRWAA